MDEPRSEWPTPGMRLSMVEHANALKCKTYYEVADIRHEIRYHADGSATHSIALGDTIARAPTNWQAMDKWFRVAREQRRDAPVSEVA